MAIPRCEKCGSVLSCQTDTFQMVRSPAGEMHPGFGKMSYVHDGPCIPKGPRLRIVGRLGPIAVAEMVYEKRCKDCPTVLSLSENSRQTQRCEPCRVAREKKLSRAKYDRERLRSLGGESAA